jgi:transcriptional regulator with XRE-family HTH domain
MNKVVNWNIYSFLSEQKMSLSTNLELLMRIHGNLSVSDLARLANIPQPTLHHILSGATRRPRKNLLNKLAAYFSISVHELIGTDSLPINIPDSLQEDLKLKSIPIIEWDMVRDWPRNRADKAHYETLILKDETAKNSFALCMLDASMEPSFPQGSLLIFAAEKKPKDRDFVISYLSKTNTLLFNRLFYENQETYIKEDLADGNAALRKLDDELDRILGTLVEVRIQY